MKVTITTIVALVCAAAATAHAQVETSKEDDAVLKQLPALSADGKQLALPVASAGAEDWNLEVAIVPVGEPSDAKGAGGVSLHGYSHDDMTGKSDDDDQPEAVTKALGAGGFTAIATVTVPDTFTGGGVTVGDLKVVFATLSDNGVDSDLQVLVERGDTQLAKAKWTGWSHDEHNADDPMAKVESHVRALFVEGDFVYVLTETIGMDLWKRQWRVVPIAATATTTTTATTTATTGFQLTDKTYQQMPPLVSADGKTLALPHAASGEAAASFGVELATVGGASDDVTIAQSTYTDENTPDDQIAKTLATLNQRFSDGGFQPATVAALVKGRATLGDLALAAKTRKGKTTLTVKRGKKQVGRSSFHGTVTRAVRAGRWLYVETHFKAMPEDPANDVAVWESMTIR